MHFYWGLGLIGVFCCVALAASVVVLKWSPWFLAWLRGSIGLGLAVCAIYLASLLYPLSAFESLGGKALVAEINLVQKADEAYSLAIKLANQVNERVIVKGEWAIVSVLTIDWVKPLKVLGVQSGFIPSEIALVNDTGNVQGKPYQFATYKNSVHAWHFLKWVSRVLPLFHLSEQKTGIFKLKRDSYHVISATSSGLTIREIDLPDSADARKLIQPAHQVPSRFTLEKQETEVVNPSAEGAQLEFDLNGYE